MAAAMINRSAIPNKSTDYFPDEEWKRFSKHLREVEMALKYKAANLKFRVSGDARWPRIRFTRRCGRVRDTVFMALRPEQPAIANEFWQIYIQREVRSALLAYKTIALRRIAEIDSHDYSLSVSVSGIMLDAMLRFEALIGEL
ncbi:hypothetical protein [Denitratimonas tolerans]|uniref:Uncharacterized protein n=1 Tax=Denitratimonas tolerans TaxID=1338420 RepID=A0AAW9R4F2_9GAMM